MFLALSSDWGCIAVLSWPTDIWGKKIGVVMKPIRVRDSFDFVGHHGLALTLKVGSFLKNR